VPDCDCSNKGTHWVCNICDPKAYEETLIADHADFLNDLLKESKDTMASSEEDFEKKEKNTWQQKT